MLKAVIFDMDGVIIDSEPLYKQATYLTLQDFGVTLTSEYLNQFTGTTSLYMFHKIIEDFKPQATLEELIALDRVYVKKMFEENTLVPLPGVIELIRELSRHGVKLAIASSSPQKRIEAVTKALGIHKYFSKLISGKEMEHPKPAPDIFLKALSLLGVNKNEALVIEDSYVGVEAANKAGIPCIGYINPNSGNQDLFSAFLATDDFHTLNYKVLEHTLMRCLGLPLTIRQTKRLIIRELSVEDIRALYQIYQNPEICMYIEGMDEYIDIEIEKHKAYIKNVYAFYNYGLWGVFSKETNELIGRCGIQNQTIDDKPEIELSYLLDREHWGCGYALECCQAVFHYAAKELGLTRIVAVIAKLNERSIKVAECLGMTIEKEIKYHNRHCYLYVANPTKLLCENATTAAVKKYQENPDTSVYSKKYR
jgi:HAD superfamily hydrolase (TIGR01509 family)